MQSLLDTNVVPELRTVGDGNADLNVTAWLSGQDPRDLYISGIKLLELERGILSVHRRNVIAIDEAIVTRCAHFYIPDRRNEADALIAATAVVHELVVSARNIPDFERAGVILVDPWRA